MLRNFVCVVSMFLLFVFCVYSAPKIEIEGGNTIDWGVVKYNNNVLKKKVKIFNKGDEPLIISKVKPSCGCTTAPLDKDTIKPKDFATLDITLKLGTTPKKYNKTIQISSNDPKNEKLMIILKAELTAPLKIEPEKFINMGNMKVGEESTAKVTFTNLSEEEIVFKEVSTSQNSISILMKKDEVIKPKEKKEFVVKVIPEKTGNFFGKITIKTNNEEMYKIDLNVNGKVEE